MPSPGKDDTGTGRRCRQSRNPDASGHRNDPNRKRKAMQNGQEDRPLHIEPELPFRQKPAEDLADPQLLPESLTDQRRTDLLRIRPDVALPGEDQKNLLRISGKGAH